MIITNKHGRKKSVLTPDEIENRAGDIISTLTHQEQDLLFGMLDDDPEEQILVTETMIEHRYHTRPVSMEQFLEDPYYLGESCSTLYPELRKDLIDLFDFPYREVVLTGGIGVGKCLRGDTEIYDPVRGSRVNVKDATLATGGSACASFDGRVTGERGCVVVQSGLKKCGDLTLASGKRLGLSPDHPVLTPDGYVAVGDLRPGDLVATAREMPAPSSPPVVSDDEVMWVAYMLTDGGTTTNSMAFTNENFEIHCEFESVTARLAFGGSGRRGCSFVENAGSAWTVRPLSTLWMREKYGLHKKATEKRVPAGFYGLDDRQLALFFNRVWACDGWVCRREGGDWEVGIALASEKFIFDIQQLMLRFGIHSRVRPRMMTYSHDGESRTSEAWSLSILGSDNVLRFVESIGEVLGKEDACRDAVRELEFVKPNSNVDITPMNRTVMKRLRNEIGPFPRAAWWPRPAMKSQMGHGVFVRFAEKYDLPDWCSWWGNVFWDRVERYDQSEVLEPVYDIEVPGTQNFAAHGIIVHNTFVLSIALCRVLYELSCLVNPQKTFGLSSGTDMVIPLISKNLILAREVMKTAVDDKVRESIYFMEKFAPKISKESTVFPNNIKVIIGSYGSERILGSNVFAVGLDETNFPPVRRSQQITTTIGQRKTAAHFDPVEKVYRNLLRRIKSRFQKAGGDFPGMVILASSAATLESFTERKIKESVNDPNVFVRDHTPWTAKPETDFCGEKFWVVCSSSSMKARILEEDEYDDVTDDYLRDNDAWLIDIPIEYLNDFETDIENALRDIGGISTQAISAYIQRVEAVDSCADDRVRHAFSMGEWTAGGPGKFKWGEMCKEFERRIPGGFIETGHIPRINPNKLRWCHIDTSLSGDCTGFSVGHIDRWVEVVRRDGDGVRFTDYEPFYHIDVLLRINPPPGEQIYMPDLRRLVYELQAHGYSFMGFSTDKYQYVEMHQQVKRRGIHCELISMDEKTDPYDELKSAIYEDRIRYHRYEPFIDEMKALEYDRLRGKIDHPQAGSKDVSDAVAGVVYGLSQGTARLPIGLGTDSHKKGRHEHAWVSPMIPVSQVGLEDAKAMAEEAVDDSDFLPILFGD